MSTPTRFHQDQWALILGGSSGFGLATAHRLASDGMAVCLVHRDRKGAMSRIEPAFEEIRKFDRPFHALNLDALTPEGITQTLDRLTVEMGSRGKVRVVLHSIAFGNLKPIAPPPSNGEPIGAFSSLIEEEDLARTLHAMGSNLLSWTQALHRRGLFASTAQVLGLTSEGNTVSWKGYAAVSAAKSVLESLSRSIAVEFGPHGIRSNILQPGVTETPALALIPGAAEMKASALKRNPLGRLTLPSDVANVVSLLAMEEANWINGALIRVDGGEHVSAL